MSCFRRLILNRPKPIPQTKKVIQSTGSQYGVVSNTTNGMGMKAEAATNADFWKRTGYRINLSYTKPMHAIPSPMDASINAACSTVPFP